MSRSKAIEMLKRHEGYRSKPYRCSAGKITIGYGRNLEDVGVNESEAEILLINDYNAAEDEASKFSWFEGLSDVRREVVIMMIFNLGYPRFTGFKKTIAALAAGDYESAASEMLDSKWAAQVGLRAFELSAMMQYDTFDV